MLGLLKKCIISIFSIPKDIIKFLKSGNLDVKNILLFIKYPLTLKEAIINLDASFKIQDGRRILNFRKLQVKFIIKNAGEIGLIIDTFSRRCEYMLAMKENYDVIDIGMFVGDSALFFARYPNIERIYSFEPFKEIFDQAQENFSINAELSKKITAYNFGLSDIDGKIDADYIEKYIPAEFRKTFHISPHAPDLIVKSANDIISKIIERSPNKIILKMDCEGNEYEILSALEKGDLLKYIDCIMLEFHYRGYKYITDILTRNNFISFIGHPFDICGTVSAVKVKTT